MQDGQTPRWFSSTVALMLEGCAYDSHVWVLCVGALQALCISSTLQIHVHYADLELSFCGLK